MTVRALALLRAQKRIEGPPSTDSIPTFALNGVFDFQAETAPEILELLVQRRESVGMCSLRHLKLFHFQQFVQKLDGGYVEILHSRCKALGMPNGPT